MKTRHSNNNKKNSLKYLFLFINGVLRKMKYLFYIYTPIKKINFFSDKIAMLY
jgi:hypothetical protein